MKLTGKPKRFIVFGGDNYYPLGGMDDFLGHCESQEDIEAVFSMAFGRYKSHEVPIWGHMLDTKTGELTDLEDRLDEYRAKKQSEEVRRVAKK